MKIICATIGSEASKKAEDRAIELAVENKGELIFVYVVDTSFLNGVIRKIRSLEETKIELRRIGRLILDSACKKAEEKGIIARAEILTGAVHEEIIRLIMLEKSDLLVIGQEKRSPLEKHFTKGMVEKFIEEIIKETGVKVEVYNK